MGYVIYGSSPLLGSFCSPGEYMRRNVASERDNHSIVAEVASPAKTSYSSDDCLFELEL